MSGAIAIDPGEMKNAAAKVGDIVDAAQTVARALPGLAGSAEMPPAMAARVNQVCAQVGGDLARSCMQIASLASEFARRAGDAERADAYGRIGSSFAGIAGFHFAVFKEAGPLAPKFTQAGAGAAAVKAAPFVGAGLDAANQMLRDADNPYLTGDQRVTRGVEAAAPGVAIGLAALAIPGPGTVVAVGVLGVAVLASVFDEEIDAAIDYVSDKIGDVIGMFG